MCYGDAMDVCIVGTGAMGAAMARNLLSRGFEVRVWDRTPEKAAALAADGARVSPAVGDAVRDADAVITMLTDAQAVRETMAPALPAMREGATWIQMSTIGVHGTLEAEALAAQLRPDVAFVDAPVSGSTKPARDGMLVILASGPPATLDALEPLFGALGRRTFRLGDAGAGSRMKLVLNTWLAALVEGIAETTALARALDVSLDALGDLLHGGPLGAPLAEAKLAKIAAGDYAPEFGLSLAAKDVRLALEAAARRGTVLPMIAALDAQWRRTIDAGYGGDDVSAAYLGLELETATRA